MRAFLPFVALVVLLISTEGVAQTPSCGSHPTDSAATYQGSFDIYVPLFSSGAQISSQYTAGASLLESAGDCEAVVKVCVWLTGSGRVDYLLTTSSLHFNGDCAGVDSIDVAMLYDQLAMEAVRQGVVLGYSTCTDSCSQSEMARVYSSTCVQRMGSGTTTQFVSCDSSSFCWRSYELCCSAINGEPFISELVGNSGTCGDGGTWGCEATCGGTGESANSEISLR